MNLIFVVILHYMIIFLMSTWYRPDNTIKSEVLMLMNTDIQFLAFFFSIFNIVFFVLLLQVMVSSKLDDLQDQDHLSLFAKISQHVALAKSHMRSISHPTPKTDEVSSSIYEVT
jgi:hypothetical protein